MKKPYKQRGKRFYYITLKNKIVTKWGKFRSRYSASNWIKKKVHISDRKDYGVEPK